MTHQHRMEPATGLYQDDLPPRKSPMSLLTRALEAQVNDTPGHELAREMFINRLCEQSGLSRNALVLARMGGMLP